MGSSNRPKEVRWPNFRGDQSVQQIRRPGQKENQQGGSDGAGNDQRQKNRNREDAKQRELVG